MRQLSVTIVTNREVVNYTLSSKTKTRAKIKTAITNKPRPQTKQMTTKKKSKSSTKIYVFQCWKIYFCFQKIYSTVFNIYPLFYKN